MTTTVQVDQSTAEALKQLYPGLTYDEAIRRLMAGFPFSPRADTYILDFILSINPATWNSQRRQAGINGVITGAFIYFPAGPSGLVEVRVQVEYRGGGRKNILPTRDDSFIALDNTPFFSSGLSIPVAANDAVVTDWYNYDGGFAHTIPVFIFVTRV